VSVHALVTGGGTGIGAAIARELGGLWLAITVVGRRAAPLEQVAAGIGERAGIITADLSEPDAARSVIAEAERARGPVLVLINNAGAAESGPFGRSGADQWLRMLAINLEAAMAMSHAALPTMQHGGWGRIVNVASTAGLKGYAYAAAYCAAKHGLIGFTRALAIELAETAITVNAVCPGFTDTDLLARSVERIVSRSDRSEEDAKAELAHFNPQGRLIDPAEVASAVLWLCAPGQRSITGQALAIAGGEVM